MKLFSYLHTFRQKSFTIILCFCLCSVTFMNYSLKLHAASKDDLMQAMEDRKSLPVESNEIENWPAGPSVGAEAAIVMEANTGVILYSKNIHEKLYPASTTKILTCLIAAETSSLDETVTFSNEAVFSLERGSSNMGMDVGQAISMEDCLL